MLLEPRDKSCDCSILEGASQTESAVTSHLVHFQVSTPQRAVIEWVGEREMLAYLSHLFGESMVMMLEAMSSQAMPVFIFPFQV